MIFTVCFRYLFFFVAAALSSDFSYSVFELFYLTWVPSKLKIAPVIFVIIHSAAHFFFFFASHFCFCRVRAWFLRFVSCPLFTFQMSLERFNTTHTIQSLSFGDQLPRDYASSVEHVSTSSVLDGHHKVVQDTRAMHQVSVGSLSWRLVNVIAIVAILKYLALDDAQ